MSTPIICTSVAKAKPEQSEPDVARGQHVVQLVRGRAERDDEREVEEQVQLGWPTGGPRPGRGPPGDAVMAAHLGHCGV
jgi:hypothetical protein